MRLKYFRVFLTVLNPQINQFGLHRASKNLGFCLSSNYVTLKRLAHHQEHLRCNYNYLLPLKSSEIKFTRLDSFLKERT